MLLLLLLAGMGEGASKPPSWSFCACLLFCTRVSFVGENGEEVKG